MGLFRDEAIAAQAQRLEGEMILLPRFDHGVLGTLLVIWLTLLALFLSQAEFSRTETVRGFLEPVSGIVRIYPRSEGRVTRLLVAEGDTVKRGQTLAIINGDQTLADGQPVASLLLEEYSEQRNTLQRGLQRIDTLNDLDRRAIHDEIAAAADNLKWLERQYETLQERLQLEQRRLDRYQQLQQRSHVTQAETEQLQSNLLDTQREWLLVASRRSQQQQALQQLATRRDSLTTRSQDKADALRLKLSHIAQEISRLRGNRAHFIKAPRDGLISNIQVQEGQRAHRQLPLMSLLPQHGSLRAALLVPVRAAGLLRVDQPVLLRYDAFPYQKYGLHEGSIASIAASALLPGEHLPYPVDIREAVYRVSVPIDQETIAAYGANVPLKAGMTLRADIELDRRSLLRWLLDPLLSMRGRLM